jgi:hypothetical protein
MPGVVEISKAVPIGVAIEELIFFVEASDQSEWEGRVVYLPLRSFATGAPVGLWARSRGLVGGFVGGDVTIEVDVDAGVRGARQFAQRR